MRLENSSLGASADNMDFSRIKMKARGSKDSPASSPGRENLVVHERDLHVTLANDLSRPLFVASQMDSGKPGLTKGGCKRRGWAVLLLFDDSLRTLYSQWVTGFSPLFPNLL